MTGSAIVASPGGVRLYVRVIPRASRTELAGIRDGRIVLRVTAPPVDRAANDAAIEAVAEWLHVPRRSVRLTAGETSRNKVVEVAGVTAGQVEALLRE